MGYRRVVRFLTSAVFVSVTLGFIGVWSVVATMIPQGDPTMGRALAWAEANPAIAPLVEVAGLYRAFDAPAFLVAVGLLALSTILCSWQRTRVARKRSHALREARDAGKLPTLTDHDLLIDYPDATSADRALSAAERALRGLGIKTRRSDGALVAASSPLAPWGSPVFHWALVGFMAFVLIGSLVRGDGLIGLAVGQAKPNVPGSYGQFTAGPWHSWNDDVLSFRLDDFEPRFTAGGVDRGPVPTLSVLDAEGRVLKTQHVYPNKMLHIGSLKVSAPAYGLSVTLSLFDETGAEVGRATQLLDFDQSAPEGTLPLEPLVVTDDTGATTALVHATVPLIPEHGQFVEWLPKDAPAHIMVNSEDGAALVDAVVEQGESVALPGDQRLQVVEVGWYSRLSVVDDWTVPFVYGWMILAALALSVTTFTRQEYVVVAALEGAEGAGLALRMRLWRHSPTTRNEITEALTRALDSGGDETQ
ncbi:MAG: cytochrome c biogenesis protein ResB [Coriobacteriia bacterium]